MRIKVLSLFDGMACGILAMRKAGIEIKSYDAYEINKYAIQVSTHNFPMIKQHGNVFEANFKEYEDIDYLIGGSPCTYWSIAQKNNRETEASGLGWELFSQYVRALHEAKPKFFVYENNKSMSKEIRASIDKTFGFEAIGINSALVSAQNRQRLYWVGVRQPDGTYTKVDIEQPKDRGILLKDVLETGEDLTGNDKAWTLTASYNGAVAWNTIERSQKNMVAEPVNCAENGKSHTLKVQHYKNGVANFVTNGGFDAIAVAEPVIFQNPHGFNKGGIKYDKAPTVTANGDYVDNNHIVEPIRVGALPRPNGELSKSQGFRIYGTSGKSVNLKANAGGTGGKTGLYAIPTSKEQAVYEVLNGLITIKGKQYPIKLADGYYIIRKLTVRECMRLQTVPEWYDFSVISNSQAYKCLGNGWTVDVIAHILKNLKNT